MKRDRPGKQCTATNVAEQEGPQRTKCRFDPGCVVPALRQEERHGRVCLHSLVVLRRGLTAVATLGPLSQHSRSSCRCRHSGVNVLRRRCSGVRSHLHHYSGEYRADRARHSVFEKMQSPTQSTSVGFTSVLTGDTCGYPVHQRAHLHDSGCGTSGAPPLPSTLFFFNWFVPVVGRHLDDSCAVSLGDVSTARAAPLIHAVCRFDLFLDTESPTHKEV